MSTAGINRTGYADPDGLETVDAWECHELCPVRAMGEMSGERPSGGKNGAGNKSIWGGVDNRKGGQMESSKGTAARFFYNADYTYEQLEQANAVYYCAKSSKTERNRGLDSTEFIMVQLSHDSKTGGELWEKLDQRVRLLVDTGQSRPRVIGASTTGNKSAIEWNTFLFGSDTTESSQISTMSITLTETNLITESKTLSWLIRSLTNAYIQDVKLETGNGGSPAESVSECNPSLSIISAETASLPGVGSVPSGTQLRISVDVKQSGRNFHPTCKPISLTKWLATLLLPPDAYAPRRLLIPFCGSGSECIGAMLAGWEHIVGVELMPEYAEIARARLAWWEQAARGTMFNDVKAILKAAKK